jgi:hypothetical protein
MLTLLLEQQGADAPDATATLASRNAHVGVYLRCSAVPQKKNSSTAVSNLIGPFACNANPPIPWQEASAVARQRG